MKLQEWKEGEELLFKNASLYMEFFRQRHSLLLSDIDSFACIEFHSNKKGSFEVHFFIFLFNET